MLAFLAVHSRLSLDSSCCSTFNAATGVGLTAKLGQVATSTARRPPPHRMNHSREVIAYFSMEIALEPDLPIYSGGLGMFAGDTIRSAADLACPWWPGRCCIDTATFASESSRACPGRTVPEQSEAPEFPRWGPGASRAYGALDGDGDLSGLDDLLANFGASCP